MPHLAKKKKKTISKKKLDNGSQYTKKTTQNFNTITKNFFFYIEIDRDPGQNGFTGVTIRGEDNAIESAKTYIQELVAAK